MHAYTPVRDTQRTCTSSSDHCAAATCGAVAPLFHQRRPSGTAVAAATQRLAAVRTATARVTQSRALSRGRWAWLPRWRSLQPPDSAAAVEKRPAIAWPSRGRFKPLCCSAFASPSAHDARSMTPTRQSVILSSEPRSDDVPHVVEESCAQISGATPSIAIVVSQATRRRAPGHPTESTSVVGRQTRPKAGCLVIAK